MNSQELLEYVRRAKDLEIGVYEAQQIEDKFYQSIEEHKPRKPAEPRYDSWVIPPPPQKTKSAAAAVAMFFFEALVCFITGVRAVNEFGFCWLSVLTFLSAGFIAIVAVIVLKERKRC